MFCSNVLSVHHTVTVRASASSTWHLSCTSHNKTTTKQQKPMADPTRQHIDVVSSLWVSWPSWYKNHFGLLLFLTHTRSSIGTPPTMMIFLPSAKDLWCRTRGLVVKITLSSNVRSDDELNAWRNDEHRRKPAMNRNRREKHNPVWDESFLSSSDGIASRNGSMSSSPWNLAGLCRPPAVYYIWQDEKHFDMTST